MLPPLDLCNSLAHIDSRISFGLKRKYADILVAMLFYKLYGRSIEHTIIPYSESPMHQ
jgi:hypothetical protein